MFTLKINKKSYEFEKPIRLKNIFNNRSYICANVNNRLRELDYIISYDANVEFFDISNVNAMRVYETTLRYVILMALYNIDKNKSYRYINSVSRSYLLCSTDDEICLTKELLTKLENELKRIIKDDLDIRRVTVTTKEAKEIFTKQCMLDKVNVLAYRNRDTVNLYKCGEYYNYLYGYMLPETSYLKKYKLMLHNPGILVSYPRSDLSGKVPEFEPNIVYDNAIVKSQDTSMFLNVDTISKINKLIEDKKEIDLINVSETIHNKRLADLGDIIEKNQRNVRLVCVAGPSSSGKTTFTNRLRVELLSRGMKPIMISLDNYYLDHDNTPLDEKGNLDFESLYALDIKRFNQDMQGLIKGQVVALREYNMHTKEIIEHGKKVSLDNNSPIIIEGIHALNDELTNAIPKKHKFKIYISPVLALNIDEQSPINVTDARMLRRIVRDKKFRNTSALHTFAMWESVRKGEFKWIYPYADNVDYFYNSTLLYELCVMKNFALEALAEISSDNPYYIEANRLTKFLKYVKSIDEKNVPCNSILREFIGGSSYGGE